MINFVSDSLKDELLKAIEELSFISGDIEDVLLEELKNYNNEQYEITINEDSIINIYVDDDCEYPAIYVKDFIDMSKNKKDLKINTSHSYAKSKTDAYFLLDIHDYSTITLLDNTFRTNKYEWTDPILPKSILEKETIIDGQKYSVSIFNGFSIFSLLLEETGECDEYCPSYSSYDYFIKVESDKEIKMDIVDSLVTAYSFEIQTAFDMKFSFSTGKIMESLIDRSDESLEGKESKMFPLITGFGTTELLALYNSARNTFDINFQILGLTKVIEYIAPTIAQKNLIEVATLKLTSPQVFNPTASYISELGQIFDKYRSDSTRDIELIKLSVLTTTTVEDIFDYIPVFIKGKQTSKTEDIKEQEILLMKVAECIYSTRNEIAHAKANYEKRGTECPSKYKEDFSEMLDKIAVRCIRWFAIQPEDKRVVLS